jgi:hypothetical protein
MKSTVALVLVLLAGALPLAAAAQSPEVGAANLQLERKQRRAIVLPKAGADEMRSEADRAVSDYAAIQRPGRILDETSPLRQSRRPDLDYDVKSGIQSQRINDALRK